MIYVPLKNRSKLGKTAERRILVGLDKGVVTSQQTSKVRPQQEIPQFTSKTLIDTSDTKTATDQQEGLSPALTNPIAQN